MYVFAVLMVFVAVVSAMPAVNKVPCVSPKAWEAEETLEMDPKNIVVVMKVSYDEVNKRVRALLQYDPAEHEFIILYNQKRFYNIEHSTGKCTVSDYDKPFTPAQVPRNATSGIEGFFGLTSHGDAFKSYYGTFGSGAQKINYVASVTSEECAVVYSKVNFAGNTIRESFFNIVLGIKDPSVFIPPKDCKEGPVFDIFKNHPRY